MDTEKNGLLDVLFDQRIYLLNQELQKLEVKRKNLLKTITQEFERESDIYEYVISSYIGATAKLYLKELDLEEIKQKCDKENTSYETKLKKMKERVRILESDILD